MAHESWSRDRRANVEEQHRRCQHLKGRPENTAPTATPDVDMGQLFPGQDVKWGLSFLINPQQGPVGCSGGSLTWAGLANTYFWVDPSKRVAGVILTQILPFTDPHVLNLYAALERGVYKSL